MADSLYFWVNGKLDKRSWRKPGSIPRGYFCVDTTEPEETNRYGKCKPGGGWEPIPFTAFPKEFRTVLLLLGVS